MSNKIKTQGGKVTLYTERPKSKYSYTLICTDIDVDDDVQTLTLISNSHEIEADYVTYDFRSVKKQFLNVETLVITANVSSVYVNNMMFPNLKRVVSKNRAYRSGDMLVCKCNNGRILLQNTFCHNKDYVIDMSGITGIEDYAFEGCQSENIINTGDITSCSKKSFYGYPVLFNEQKYMNGVFTIDNRILVAVNDDSVVEIPRDINVAVDNLSFGEDDNKEVIIYDINQLRYIPGIKGKLTIKDTSYLTFLQMQDILNYACRVKELNIVDNPFYCTVNNAVFTKDKKVLVYFQNNIKGRYEIPEGTETIWDNAFYGASLSSVKLPESLCYIHANAFCECKLSAVEFNHTMTHFEQCCGNGIFSSCGTFSELEIPGYVKGLSKNMFSNSKINKLVLNEGLESIESGALSGYTAQEITLPKSLKYVGNYNFSQATVIHVTGKRVPYGLLRAVTSTYS